MGERRGGERETGGEERERRRKGKEEGGVGWENGERGREVREREPICAPFPSLKSFRKVVFETFFYLFWTDRR